MTTRTQFQGMNGGKTMTYLQRYGNIENMLKERAEKWLQSIETKGYTFYSKAATRHINLFKMSERYMNADELAAKRKAEEHVSFLKDRVEGKIIPEPIEVMEWMYFKDKEYPTWRD